MQLAVTLLATQQHFMAELFSAIQDSKCHILEIRSSHLGQVRACYLLIEGHWNQIAKFEHAIEALEKRSDIKVQLLRTEQQEKAEAYLPYSIESISFAQEPIVEAIANFLLEQGIEIAEITGSSYQAPYLDTSVFSSRLIVLVPSSVSLMVLREEFMDLCDQLNIDAILEPVKR